MPARGTSKTALASLVESWNEDSLPWVYAEVCTADLGPPWFANDKN